MQVLYEDEYIIVVDKPAGVSMHAAGENDKSETVSSLLARKIDDPTAKFPGIVHRLDKDSSGVVVIAKDADSRQRLQSQFKNRQVVKLYLAAVVGAPEQAEAVIDIPIGRHPKNHLKRKVRPDGKIAVTKYKTIDQRSNFCMLEVWPSTGRTHQIRVHMSYIGHPLVGDKLYGRSDKRLGRHFLHAVELTFKHPGSGKTVTFGSPLAGELDSFWYNLP